MSYVRPHLRRTKHGVTMVSGHSRRSWGGSGGGGGGGNDVGGAALLVFALIGGIGYGLYHVALFVIAHALTVLLVVGAIAVIPGSIWLHGALRTNRRSKFLDAARVLCDDYAPSVAQCGEVARMRHACGNPPELQSELQLLLVHARGLRPTDSAIGVHRLAMIEVALGFPPSRLINEGEP